MKYLALIVLAFSMSSCVSLSKHKKELREAVASANDICEQLSVIKDDRLRKFNQLNPDGSLR